MEIWMYYFRIIGYGASEYQNKFHRKSHCIVLKMGTNSF